MLKRLILQFIQTVLAIAVTFPAAGWAVRYAYENRGYEAVGGEYFFIFFIYLSIYTGSRWLISILEELQQKWGML